MANDMRESGGFRNCIFCLSRGSMELRFDKRDRPYLITSCCGVRAFLRSRVCYRGVVLMSTFIDAVPDERDLQRAIDATYVDGAVKAMAAVLTAAAQAASPATAPVAPVTGAPAAAPATVTAVPDRPASSTAAAPTTPAPWTPTPFTVAAAAAPTNAPSPEAPTTRRTSARTGDSRHGPFLPPSERR